MVHWLIIWSVVLLSGALALVREVIAGSDSCLPVSHPRWFTATSPGLFMVHRWNDIKMPRAGAGNACVAATTDHVDHVPRLAGSTTVRAALFDAVVLPSARGAASVLRAATTARNADAQLVVLASGNTTASDTSHLLQSNGWPTNSFLAIDVESGHPPSWSEPLSTAQHPMVAQGTDVALKRNIGLALAQVLGWQRILYVDDDVQSIQTSELHRAANLLQGADRQRGPRRLVGWAFDQFPDCSVVGHAYQFGRQETPTFIGGGAVALTCASPMPFFPAIYNEDLLFVLHALRKDPQSVCLIGTLRQDEYSPYTDTALVVRQEFGDVLTQGLYKLFREDALASTATLPEYWESVLADRAALLSQSAARLDRLGVTRLTTECLRKARAQHGADWPHLLASYVEAWDHDLPVWQAALDRLPKVASLAQAAAALGLAQPNAQCARIQK